MTADEPQPGALRLLFCGEQYSVKHDGTFVIGREGDLALDDNPYLHRKFLQLFYERQLWWIANIGSRISATVADTNATVHSWLAPGSRLPVVFARTSVRFTAGPTTYEVELVQLDPPFMGLNTYADLGGESTIGPVPLTPDQRRLITALAEPILRGTAHGSGSVPSSGEAAARLGWTQTKFNRKLDNVCDKLARIGVRGLHGNAGALASNRRARLVEYALAARLVEQADLADLDRPLVSE